MSISKKNNQYYTIDYIPHTIHCIPTFGPPCIMNQENPDIISIPYMKGPFFLGFEETQAPVSLRRASLIATDTNI